MAGGKVRAISIENNDLYAIVLGGKIKCVIQLVEHGFVLGISHVNAIERNARNLIRDRVDNG